MPQPDPSRRHTHWRILRRTRVIVVRVYIRARLAALTALETLFLLRAHAALGMLSVVLMQPPQALESIQAALTDAVWHPAANIAAAGAALGITLWYLSRQLLTLRPPRIRWRQASRDLVTRWAPRLLGVLPSLGLCLAGVRVRDELPQGSRLWPLAHDAALLNFFLAVLLLAAFTARRAILDRMPARAGPRAVPFLGRRIDLPPLTVALLAALTLVAVTLAVMPVVSPAWAQHVGPTVVVLAALAAWAGLLLVPVALANVRRWPVLLLLGGSALLWEGLDLSDNHRLRTLPAPSAPPPPSLRQAFDRWLDAAPRRDPARPYPVVLVATEGGGIRAAYFTAQVLSRLHRASGGRLGDHLFAVSGVSGGAVGSAVFASLLVSPPATPIEDAAGRALQDDLLAPVLASGLLADTVHRVLPLGERAARLDRARSLEDALSAGLAAALPRGAPNPLESGLRELWRHSRAPVLLLNTTHVETGERVVLAPVSGVPDIPPERLRFFFDEFPRAGDVPLKTAACLAARFPYVTPPGWVEKRADDPLAGPASLGPGKHRLVDGGYFENSGTATLLDVLDALAPTPGVVFIVVTIWYREPTPTPADGFGELWSPPEALMNTRPGRGRLSRQLLRDAAGAGGPIEFVLERRHSRLPLGWHLSRDSRDEIDKAAAAMVAGEEGRRLLEALRASD